MCINESYRNRLLQLYKRCLLSGYDAVQCDAAHIIPQYICYRFSLPDLVDDIYNGMILTKDLHSTFDNYFWTFDIYDIQLENNYSEWCQIPIIVKQNKKNLAINQFNGVFIKVPVRSLAFLWINYKVFMMVNYQGGKLKETYQELLGSEEYLQLLENPRILSTVKPNLNDGVIIGKKAFGYLYQVIFQGVAWRNRAWINVDQIPHKMISLYEDHDAKQDDPDWIFNGTPPKK